MVKKKLLIVSEITKKYYKKFDLSKFDIILANKENYTKYISDCDYIIAGREYYSKELLKKEKKLKLISRCGHGTDNIEKIDKISVSDVKGALNTTVAEITICYILMGLRDTILLDENCRKGDWEPKIGNTLKGKTIGIIGYGNIGQEVARLLKIFDVNILYYDILPYRKNCKLEDLLTESDIITLHCNKNETSINMINNNTISKMKDGVILINTARGGIINERDLLNHINKFKCVVLDVFDVEPTSISNKLLKCKNTILGTHSANATEEGWRLMAKMAVENIINYENNLCDSS
jgi:D-3-phosphoglycerate dehydrogenase